MTSPSTPSPLPDALSGPLEKLVFLYVRQHGRSTVRELRDALGVPQLRLYPTLASLARRGLVKRSGDDVWLPDDRFADPVGLRS